MNARAHGGGATRSRRRGASAPARSSARRARAGAAARPTVAPGDPRPRSAGMHGASGGGAPPKHGKYWHAVGARAHLVVEAPLDRAALMARGPTAALLPRARQAVDRRPGPAGEPARAAFAARAPRCRASARARAEMLTAVASRAGTPAIGALAGGAGAATRARPATRRSATRSS